MKGSTTGKLAGKRIAIKDNICIAGLPMMNGSAILEGHIADDDATVVQRVLNEGATVIGKTTCEDLCFSGASYWTQKGPVRNPHNKDYSAGGSSSGCGVLVATGEADMAIGGDQGGSVRIPASNCGIVALKPTHGLVPYTSASPIIPAVDHLGPMTKNVADCALLLEVLAGYDDGKDYRQNPFIQVPNYSELIYPKKPLDRPIKVGVLKEGVDVCDQNVIEIFHEALIKINKKSNLFQVSTVSMPNHVNTDRLMSVLFHSGCYGAMVRGCGYGTSITGYQAPSLVQKYFEGFKNKSSEMNHVLKQLMLIGDQVNENHGPYHYAKTSSIISRLKAEYEALFKEFDVIIMPTLNCLPCKIPSSEAPIKERITEALSMIKNTAIFDATGHPALSLNCGFSTEMKFPVGLMVVGKLWDDLGVLNAASVMESVFDL
ncbi:amidase-like [Clytia hemisphaerica]